MKIAPHAALVLSLVLLASCSRSPGAHSEGRASPPDAVVRAMIEAANAGDAEGFFSRLTSKARAGLESGSSLSLKEARTEDYTVHAGEIEGEEARVRVDGTRNGQRQTMHFLLRREESAWRAWGVSVELGRGPGSELTMNFEEIGDIAETLAKELGSSLKEQVTKAFEDAQRGGSPEELARAKEAFEAIAPVTRDAFEKTWRVAKEYGGEPVGAAIEAIAAELDLAVDAGPHGKVLAAPVSASLGGKSRLEAIELLAAQVGLHAVFPSLRDAEIARQRAAWNRERGERSADAAAERLTVRLEEGARATPIAFSGPFVVEIADLEEKVPYATGSAGVVLRAFGVEPGLLTLLDDLGESVTIGRVVDSGGRSLKKHEDVRYFGGGMVVGSAFESTTRLELRNLLRSVEEIALLEGTHRVLLPVEILEATFDDLARGAIKQVGDLEVEVGEVGELTSLELRFPTESEDELTVRFWASDRDGNTVGILGQSTARWGPERVQSSVNTAAVPARLALRIIRKREVLDYPFALRGIPLARHEEMPEAIDELSFAGSEAPLTMRFKEFRDRDDDFPKVVLEVENHSNKDVLSARARFVYLDAAGTELKDFPHSLTGAFSAAGYQPVAARRSTGEVESTAFFMPPETARVRIELEEVEFADGTTWTGEDE